MGADIPTRTDYVRALKPLLDRFGNERDLTLILFTLDETSYSRELAPLAGHYPILKLGPAWWFYNSPEGMRRFRELTTETAGFYNTVGFNDDTRAFCSIPARHDVARRVDCALSRRACGEAPARRGRGARGRARSRLQSRQEGLQALAAMQRLIRRNPVPVAGRRRAAALSTRGDVATGIVHLGLGAFQRAHQAMYTEAALNAGDRRWGILGASLRSPARARCAEAAGRALHAGGARGGRRAAAGHRRDQGCAGRAGKSAALCSMRSAIPP